MLNAIKKVQPKVYESMQVSNPQSLKNRDINDYIIGYNENMKQKKRQKRQELFENMIQNKKE